MTDHPGWQGILEQDEQILWQGQPAGGIRFDPEDLRGTLMGLFMTCFALFWMWGASQGSVVFALFGIPFLAIGLAETLKGNVIAAYVRSRSWYTLTNRRAIIATDMPVRGRRLTTYPIGPGTPLELIEGDPGSILFGSTTGRRSRRGSEPRAGFRLIHDTRKVWSLMQQAQTERLAPTADDMRNPA